MTENIVKIEKINSYKILDSYKDLVKEFQELQKKFQKKLPKLSKKKDARLEVIILMTNHLESSFYLQDMVIENFPSILERYEISGELTKEEFIKKNQYYLTDEIRDNLFLNIFMRFEHFNKIIGSCLNVKNENLNLRSKEIIDQLKLNNEYKNLIDIFCYVRNTVHNGGIHNKENASKTYKKENYKFEYKKPITFFNHKFLFMIIFEIKLLIEDVIFNETIIKLDKIEGDYFAINFQNSPNQSTSQSPHHTTLLK